MYHLERVSGSGGSSADTRGVTEWTVKLFNTTGLPSSPPIPSCSFAVPGSWHRYQESPGEVGQLTAFQPPDQVVLNRAGARERPRSSVRCSSSKYGPGVGVGTRGSSKVPSSLLLAGSLSLSLKVPGA